MCIFRRSGMGGVICNSAEQAREVFNRLPQEKILLTGRIRPLDKDALLAEYLPRIRCGSRELRAPLLVVATQTIEVGADLDFDALRQRFGRLDRLGIAGCSEAVIVYPDLGRDDECPIYGKALLKETWRLLQKAQQGKGKNKRVDFGIDAMAVTLSDTPPPIKQIDNVRLLTDDDVRQLRQTVPAIDIDIAPWLHGEDQDQISVSVVWRDDLGDDESLWPEMVDAARPVIAEMMPCPLHSVRRWLNHRKVVVGDKVLPGNKVRPGDVIVAPSTDGGCDQWGWAAHSNEPVADVGNLVAGRVRLSGGDDSTDIPVALAKIGRRFELPIATSYPGGLVVQEANRRVAMHAIPLDAHLAGIRKVAVNLMLAPLQKRGYLPLFKKCLFSTQSRNFRLA